jgi:hypothetical protein
LLGVPSNKLGREWRGVFLNSTLACLDEHGACLNGVGRAQILYKIMEKLKTITTAERRELEERIVWELGPSAMCVGKLSSQLGILPEIISDVIDGLVERRLLVRESGDAEPIYANRFKRVYRLSSRALAFVRRGKDPTDTVGPESPSTHG